MKYFFPAANDDVIAPMACAQRIDRDKVNALSEHSTGHVKGEDRGIRKPRDATSQTV
jgi:hypothetical protein